MIIMVDDSLTNLLIGKQSLEEKYTVVAVPSAKQLFSFLVNNIPVLILLDIDMPKMNGFEPIKILKEKPETRDLPVIFLLVIREYSYFSCVLM